ncbi:MAG: saccharopine dehydrogenase NADP-binding domain-containing protein [Mycobacteriaceae bacterium]|nr:saccharopine dehydrogenase NADP-binding domain-containing protein [Mycobacteriaceae bacterium]
MSSDLRYGRLLGPVVIIGFGSIGRGVLPLIVRHFEVASEDIVVIAPNAEGDAILKEYGVRRIDGTLSPENYRDLLAPLLDGPAPFVVNVSVDTSSVDVLHLARAHHALYIDTVVEPWPGCYGNETLELAQRTNYALRQSLLAERHAHPGGITAVSCCGANPGMVSWFVKQALINLAAELGREVDLPQSRQEWARLMRDLGVKGIHIAERDTQRARWPRKIGQFINTWSVEGFLSEGMQPAELGWGTHEKWFPPMGNRHDDPTAPSIYLSQPGAATKVRTWCPTGGAQHGLCVTHNESISITEYFTLTENDQVTYRPTCHYAYQPCDEALLSWHEMLGGRDPSEHVVLDEADIVDGIDELGVLLYGHQRNAYWFGSRLSNAETRALAPYQNATGLQVTSAILAGMVWALENPQAGIVEVEEMDFQRCLQVQLPYLGPVEGHFTDWHPLHERSTLFPDNIDTDDPWQFRNVLVH